MGQFDVLRELGLSKTGIRCYVHLLKNGPATTRRLASQLKLSQTNLYGVLKKLTEQGFVSEFKMTTQPTLFKAHPLNLALREHYMYQRLQVMPLCREMGVPQPPALPRFKYFK